MHKPRRAWYFKLKNYENHLPSNPFWLHYSMFLSVEGHSSAGRSDSQAERNYCPIAAKDIPSG